MKRSSGKKQLGNNGRKNKLVAKIKKLGSWNPEMIGYSTKKLTSFCVPKKEK